MFFDNGDRALGHVRCRRGAFGAPFALCVDADLTARFDTAHYFR